MVKTFQYGHKFQKWSKMVKKCFKKTKKNINNGQQLSTTVNMVNKNSKRLETVNTVDMIKNGLKLSKNGQKQSKAV